MKKILIIALTTLILTGCGNVITCKTTDDDVSETYKIKYNGNDVTKVTTQKIYKFETKEEFKNYEPMMEYLIKSNVDENVKSSYKKKKKKYILTQIYNIENMNDDDLIKYGLNKNKEELINSLKTSGLTCK